MPRTKRKKQAGKRMAKMVTPQTNRLISEMAERAQVHLRLQGRLSDNEVIRMAVIEWLETHGE